MAEDKKLETIESEIKLLKGELKNSLASVRDYLLNMELPSAEFATILAALGEGGDQKVTMKGSFSTPPAGDQNIGTGDEITEPAQDSVEEPYEEEVEEPLDEEPEMPIEQDDLAGMESPLGDESEIMSEGGAGGPEGSLGEEQGVSPEDELSPEGEGEEGEEGESGAFDELGEPDELDEQDDSIAPGEELPIEEEQPMDYDKTAAEVNPSIPKVNMLANLINWVARAKKEIGYEQLPTFLEVYGISGHLSPELKETIVQLAEIAAEQPEAASNAEVWSQSMLSLHGILTGGDAPRYPIIPSWGDVRAEAQGEEEEIIEVDKKKDTSVKLKLVFPNGDGESKEYCIDLNPEMDSNGSSVKSSQRELKRGD